MKRIFVILIILFLFIGCTRPPLSRKNNIIKYYNVVYGGDYIKITTWNYKPYCIPSDNDLIQRFYKIDRQGNKGKLIKTIRGEFVSGEFTKREFKDK